ncbi:MAG: LLM class flavin-dependent oxidoreductase [Alphaproteobacteria bacterium]|nr:LLM class flavin-dependent oxidoreductase [Alphaproteobacteria bacterium]
MQFGLLTTKIDEIGLITRAENLGYDFCWISDSPLIRSNPWAVMALAAHQTQTIRLGTGLAIPGLRLAPVAANGIATINRLAPGRTFLGVGTGNTAMRTMGQKPATIKAFAEYIRVVRALIRGEEADYTLDGITHPIRMQNLELRYVDVEHDIPIHVGGFGPRAQALAGELGDGLISGIPRGGTIPQALANAKKGADKAGRTLDNFEMTVLANLVMLEPGETLDSQRVVAECGSSIMANVHYLVDWVKETGNAPPDYVMPIWDEYMAFHQSRDADRAHQQLHASHYSYLDPDEARFVTPEMIRTFCIAGQPDEIIERLHELEAEGLNAINFSFPLERQYRMIEDFATRVIHRM